MSSGYDVIRLFVGSKIEDYMTSKVVLDKIIKRTRNRGMLVGGLESKALGSSFSCLK
jgi:hypothetical protein